MIAVVIALISLLTAACDAPLPEPDSPEATLYRERCTGGCHRLYAPAALTADMWRYMVARMEDEFRRRGVPPLTGEERLAILRYLEKHSAGNR